MNYEAIIFDLDGTLLDTLDDIADSLNATLEHEGRQAISREEVRAAIGYGVSNLVKGVFGDEPMSDEQLAGRIQYYRNEYSRRLDHKTHLYEGVATMLDTIAGTGLKTAILSNKSDTFTQAIVQKYFSRWKFDIIAGEMPGKPIKPDPSAALEIASALGVQPGRMALAGDSETDMKTALAAGMLPVGVLWGFRSREQLLAAGAKILVERAQGLLSVLGI